MKRIAAIVKQNRPEGVRIAAQLAEWLSERGVELYLDKEVAQAAPRALPVDVEKIPGLVDLVVVLGGDGTLLSVARLVSEKGIPILGVNLGGLGFLTEVSLAELYPVMEKVLEGDFETSSRMTLQGEVIRGKENLGGYTVLNDAVINTGVLARIIELETYVDGHILTTFRADGLIVTSPTGSTGYSLAAGGSIIHPSLSCIGITPICPHMLTNRPILVSDMSTIEVVLKTRGVEVMLTLDGQVGFALEVGDRVRIRKGTSVVQLVKNPMRNYFSVLREKLKWGQ
ncbi:MAG: NAD(+)/NADH kinase [Thermodesulfobacteriota bacterium]